MKKIILGVFCARFDEMKDKLIAMEFGSDWVFARLVEQHEYQFFDVVDVVRSASRNADVIYFMLDELYFPVGKNITCEELTIILSSEDLLDKTTFFFDGVKLSKNFVLQRIAILSSTGEPEMFSL